MGLAVAGVTLALTFFPATDTRRRRPIDLGCRRLRWRLVAGLVGWLAFARPAVELFVEPAMRAMYKHAAVGPANSAKWSAAVPVERAVPGDRQPRQLVRPVFHCRGGPPGDRPDDDGRVLRPAGDYAG